MQDAWRAYLELALGLTETSRKRATKVVKKLAKQSGATVEQLQTMAEDLVSAGSANRDALVKLVRYEMDRNLGRVGLATTEEVSELNDRVRDLESKLKDAESRAEAAERAAERAAASATVRSGAKKTAAKSTAKTATAKKTAAKTTAKKTAAKSAAKKAAPAKKSAAPAKKAAPGGDGR